MGCSSSREKLESKILLLKLRRIEIKKERDEHLAELSKMTGREVFREPVIDYLIYPNDEILRQRQEKLLHSDNIKINNDILNHPKVIKFKSSSVMHRGNNVNDLSSFGTTKSTRKMKDEYDNGNSYSENRKYNKMNHSYVGRGKRKGNCMNKSCGNLNGINLHKQDSRNYALGSRSRSKNNTGKLIKMHLLKKPTVNNNTNSKYQFNDSYGYSNGFESSFYESLPKIRNKHTNNFNDYGYGESYEDDCSVILRDRYNK